METDEDPEVRPHLLAAGRSYLCNRDSRESPRTCRARWDHGSVRSHTRFPSEPAQPRGVPSCRQPSGSPAREMEHMADTSRYSKNLVKAVSACVHTENTGLRHNLF